VVLDEEQPPGAPGRRQGLRHPIDSAAQKGAEGAYLDLVLTGYRKARANHTPDAEGAHEMRAAFSPGQDVVDVVAGKNYRT
jgi:hypothetical protein